MSKRDPTSTRTVIICINKAKRVGREIFFIRQARWDCYTSEERPHIVADIYLRFRTGGKGRGRAENPQEHCLTGVHKTPLQPHPAERAVLVRQGHLGRVCVLVMKKGVPMIVRATIRRKGSRGTGVHGERRLRYNMASVLPQENF